MEKSEAGNSGDGFIDRSKVRILLCDNDEKSSEEIFTLLCKCSYQVISVRSPRQVIDALNAEGPDIDIILSEVDLPIPKGLKMLKYIMRDKDLRRIPVIMMSAQDEVSIVVKCLKFGAADYLVKPLRTNELLNLWTHMWRRRRMLGLSEKNIVIYDLDLVASDPSDANTNSTTLFSDDIEEKSQKNNNPDMCVSIHEEDEIHATTEATPTDTGNWNLSECRPDVPGMSYNQTGQVSSFQKNELKIGESSAFFTYVKLSIPNSNNQGGASVPQNAPQNSKIVENPSMAIDQVSAHVHEQHNTMTVENHCHGEEYPSSTSIQDSFSAERSCTPMSLDISQHKNSDEHFSDSHMHSRNDSPTDIQAYTHAPSPYYMPGVMNPVTMSPASLYHKYLPDMPSHAAVLPQYNPSHIPGMPPYPYFPFGICIQPGQMPAPHPWPSFGSPAPKEGSSSKVDRREAALMKFRQKRKERCFDKKIRYVNRKKLAESRPRVRGQFVRKVNGISVDLNGQPASAEEDDEEDEEDEEEEDEV